MLIGNCSRLSMINVRDKSSIRYIMIEKLEIYIIMTPSVEP